MVWRRYIYFSSFEIIRYLIYLYNFMSRMSPCLISSFCLCNNFPSFFCLTLRCTVSRYWVAQILRITRNRRNERKQLFVAKYTQIIVLCSDASQWLRYRIKESYMWCMQMLTSVPLNKCSCTILYVRIVQCTQRKGHHAYTFVICIL